MEGKPVAAGKSSFDLIDVNKVFELMKIQKHSKCVDLACGMGHYSFELSRRTGEQGLVYAIDLWEEGISTLNRVISERNVKNIKPLRLDITEELPVENQSVDSCLMATILHDLSKEDQKSAICEVFRILKPGGFLNIIEFRKIDNGPGPPLSVRIDDVDVDKLVIPIGFEKVLYENTGNFNYLLRYMKNTGV